MTRNFSLQIVLLFIVSTLSSCEAFLILTSSYHEPQIETQESITRFATRKGISGYPILRFDKSILDFDYFIGYDFLMFNHEGQYLLLSDTTPGCEDKNYRYTTMNYILGHEDKHFVTDSMTERYFTFNDSTEDAKLLNNKTMHRPPIDSSKVEFKTYTYSTHLDNYAPYLRTLEGNKVDVYSLYTDYLIIQGYNMSGRPGPLCFLIREKIREIKKLNQEFGNRIQFVLINWDEMEPIK